MPPIHTLISMRLHIQHVESPRNLFSNKELGNLVEERTVFFMNTLVVQTEEEYCQLKEIEKVEAVVLTKLKKKV